MNLVTSSQSISVGAFGEPRTFKIMSLAFLLRGVDAERHPRPPLLVDPSEDFAEPLEVLLCEVDHPEVQVERVLVRPPTVEQDGARPVQLVLGLRELVDDLLQKTFVREGLQGMRFTSIGKDYMALPCFPCLGVLDEEN